MYIVIARTLRANDAVAGRMVAIALVVLQLLVATNHAAAAIQSHAMLNVIMGAVNLRLCNVRHLGASRACASCLGNRDVHTTITAVGSGLGILCAERTFAYPPYSLTFVTGGCVACHPERSTRARDGRHGACGPRPPRVQPPGAVGIVELTLPPSHRVRGLSRHAAAIRHFGYFACAAAARGCTGARPERGRTATPSSLQLALRPCVSASTCNNTVGPDQGSAARPAQHERAPPLRLRRLIAASITMR